MDGAKLAPDTLAHAFSSVMGQVGGPVAQKQGGDVLWSGRS